MNLCDCCGEPTSNISGGFNAEVICDDCSERAYDRHQERLMEGGGGPTLQEQQVAAWKIKHGVR